MIYLGVDTSNNATSAALYDSAARTLLGHQKLMLPVAKGALGLRQSDAVFSHIKNLPAVFEALFQVSGVRHIDAVGVSSRPRTLEGSYMPCFLAGVASATAVAASHGAPLYAFSHQQGHVMAALYGCGLAFEDELDFTAFHVSGGTTDGLYCALAGKELRIEQAATSLDLFAGQAVDRTGALLGFDFPSGPQLSALAETSGSPQFMKPVLKGRDCCLSGLQNKCEKLFADGAAPQDIARYCLLSVGETVAAMCDRMLADRPQQPLVFAGGVLSSSVIRRQLSARFPSARFCEPAWLSADNAAGIAVLASRENAS